MSCQHIGENDTDGGRVEPGTSNSPLNLQHSKTMSAEKTIEQRLERIEQLTQLSLLAAKEALTMDEAAAYTGLSKSYLYKLVCKKRIPYYKSAGGKQNYFAKTELSEWLLKHRVSTVEEAQERAAAYCVSNPKNGQKGGAR